MLIIPGLLATFQSLKDKTLKLVFETQELTPSQTGDVVSCLGEFGYLAFKREGFSKDERELIDGLKSEYEEGGKTPAQRLRAVLFLNWKQNSEGYEDFNMYYSHHLEKVINHFKNKLDG